MEMTTEKVVIEKLIFDFEDTINAGDISKIVSMYSTDAVIMPNNAPSAKGTVQIKSLYYNLLKAADIKLAYTVEDIVVCGEYAFVRTSSQVTTTVNADGNTIALENKELFILQQIDQQWLIANYIFNNTHKN